MELVVHIVGSGSAEFLLSLILNKLSCVHHWYWFVQWAINLVESQSILWFVSECCSAMLLFRSLFLVTHLSSVSRVFNSHCSQQCKWPSSHSMTSYKLLIVFVGVIFVFHVSNCLSHE